MTVEPKEWSSGEVFCKYCLESSWHFLGSCENLISGGNNHIVSLSCLFCLDVCKYSVSYLCHFKLYDMKLDCEYVYLISETILLNCEVAL